MSAVPMVSASPHHSLALDARHSYVTMRVGGQLFGASVMSVEDVLRRQTIARIPLAPGDIAGSLNLRGRIVTVIDMRKRLGLPDFDAGTPVLHVVVGNEGELCSLMVDSVGDVLSIPASAIEKTPSNLDARWSDVATGVYRLEEELIVLLDIRSTLTMNHP